MSTRPPTRSRPADRRSELLAAARVVFAKKGYESATVSEIVGRAGVAQGTFYLYFPGKEALAGAFAESVAERFAEVADEKTSRSRSFDAAVAKLFEAAYTVGDEFRDVFLIANRGLELVEDLDEWMNLTAPSRDWIERFVREWQVQGSIDARIRPAVTARVLRDALDRAAKSYVVFGDRNYGRDMAEMFRRGLSAPASA
jgi:AcrR family transcriptional regulator